MGGMRGMDSCDECGARLWIPVLWRLLSLSPFFGLLAASNWLGLDLRINPWMYVGSFSLCIVLQLFVAPVVMTPRNIADQKLKPLD